MPRLAIACSVFALAASAFAAPGAAAQDIHPTSLGCPADFVAVKALAARLKLSDKRPGGIFTWQYDGKVSVLGVEAGGMMVSSALPLTIGFSLPSSYKAALARSNMACEASGCATVVRAGIDQVMRATVVVEEGGSYELWCHYETSSLGELGKAPLPTH